jgi:hypothetical protein
LQDSGLAQFIVPFMAYRVRQAIAQARANRGGIQRP